MDDEAREVEALYHLHGRALLGYLRRSFSGTEAAEDLLHETFVHALRRADRLAEAASPRAWLFGIARHVGLTALRRRRTELLPAETASAPPAEADERLDRMRRAIAALPPPQREAIELRLVDELSYEDIAAVLGVPVGTVRSRLHHVVRRLRETLAGGADGAAGCRSDSEDLA